MADAPPDLLSLRDVLARLRGCVGRTNLLAHLRATPHHAGGPTHRRNGRKVLFTEGDYQRLLASLVPGHPTVTPVPTGGNQAPAQSEDRQFRRASARLAKAMQKPSRAPRAERR